MDSGEGEASSGSLADARQLLADLRSMGIGVGIFSRERGTLLAGPFDRVTEEIWAEINRHRGALIAILEEKGDF